MYFYELIRARAWMAIISSWLGRRPPVRLTARADPSRLGMRTDDRLTSSWLDIRELSPGRSIVSMSFVDTTQTLFTSEDECRMPRPMMFTTKSSDEYLVPGERNEDGVAGGRLLWSGGDGVDVNNGGVRLGGGGGLGVTGSSSSDGAKRGFVSVRVKFGFSNTTVGRSVIVGRNTVVGIGGALA